MSTENPRFNYTGHGWEGSRYESNRSADIAEIAKATKAYAKKKYPGCKFSVRIKRYSGGQSMTIALMEAPWPAFVLDDGHKWEKGYAQLNYQLNYRLDPEDSYSNGAHLTREACEAIKDVLNYAESYNFDDSDGQIDYFHCNFYLHVEVGAWNKDFVQTT